MHDLKPEAEKAYLVGIQTHPESEEHALSMLAELRELVASLGVEFGGQTLVRLREHNSHFLIGSGKAEEIIEAAKAAGAKLIVFDQELSPAQQRNWEKAAGLGVTDRQEVILDIFGQRAHSREAVLQVELARLEYELPRLKRAWTHLDRQRGGGSTQRGEGELQIELDSRMVRDKIARTKRELLEVIQQRSTQRKQRLRKPVPVAAIVGYTNAGKSSLLNTLTHAGVLAENKLFATLDPTVRRLELPDGREVLLSDTVGFIRRLPHGLIDAFKATLEEAVLADVLLHVVDISNPEHEEHIATTKAVLAEIGAGDKPVLMVCNKADLLEPDERARRLALGTAHTVLLSTKTGEGIPQLLHELTHMVQDETRVVEVRIPHSRFDLVARFHSQARVQEEEFLDEVVRLKGVLDMRFANVFNGFLTVL